MIDAIQPRWLILAAVAAFAVAGVGLYLGWSSWAPMALLAGEFLTILAAIAATTPSIQQSLAAQKAAAEDNNITSSETPAAVTTASPPEDRE